jgi:hypothetical protein
MTCLRINFKQGWQLLALAGALHWAAGCGSSGNGTMNLTASGGTDGGGIGGKLGGVGGRSGTGGSSPVDAANPACAAGLYSRVSAFGAIFDSWDVANNSSDGLAPMTSADGSFTGGTLRELDLNDGDPTKGSVKLTIPFTTVNQTLLFARLYAGVNMTGMTVTARVKLDSGLITGPSDIGQAFLALKSTSVYLYGSGPDVTLDPSGGWTTISASADFPSANTQPGYTACDIREIDVVIQTGATGNYRQAVVHIDTISISGPGADAGSDDAEPATDGGDASAGGDLAADGPVEAGAGG